MLTYLFLGALYVVVETIVSKQTRNIVINGDPFLVVITVTTCILAWLPLSLVNIVRYFGGKTQ